MANPPDIKNPSRINFARAELIGVCKKNGALLDLANTGIDGVRLLWALAGNESSFGRDCKPRYESAFYTGGAYGSSDQMVPLITKFGHNAACSYGAWQLMLVNAPVGTTPEDFANLDNACLLTINHINRRIIKAQGAKTVEEIADAYNSGSFRGGVIPRKYISDCLHNYSVPMQ